MEQPYPLLMINLYDANNHLMWSFAEDSMDETQHDVWLE